MIWKYFVKFFFLVVECWNACPQDSLQEVTQEVTSTPGCVSSIWSLAEEKGVEVTQPSSLLFRMSIPMWLGKACIYKWYIFGVEPWLGLG